MAAVQVSGKIRTSGASSVSGNLPGNFTGGNTAIVLGVSYGVAPTIVINGSTAAIDQNIDADGSNRSWIQRVQTLAGGSSAFSATGTSDYLTFSIEEWSGIVAGTPPVTTNSGSGSGVSVGPTGSAPAGSLVAAVWAAVEGNSNLGSALSSAGWVSSWIEQDSNTYEGGAAATLIVPSTGAQTATWTRSGSVGPYVGVTAVYAMSAGPSGLTASASISLGGVTSAGTAQAAVKPSQSTTLGGVTAAGTATTTHNATASQTLDAVAAAGAATGTAPGLLASAAVALQDVSSSGSTQVRLSGSATQATDITATGLSTLRLSSTASQTLGGFSAAGSSTARTQAQATNSHSFTAAGSATTQNNATATNIVAATVVGTATVPTQAGGVASHDFSASGSGYLTPIGSGANSNQVLQDVGSTGAAVARVTASATNETNVSASGFTSTQGEIRVASAAITLDSVGASGTASTTLSSNASNGLAFGASGVVTLPLNAAGAVTYGVTCTGSAFIGDIAGPAARTVTILASSRVVELEISGRQLAAIASDRKITVN